MSGMEQMHLEQNKQLVRDFYRRVFDAQNPAAVKDFVTEDYRQHARHMPDGRAALEGFVKAIFPNGPVDEPQDMLHPPAFIVAEGDMVVVAAYMPQPEPESPGQPPGQPLGQTYDYFVFDAFRIREGKLAEHWSSINKIAPPRHG